MSPPTGLFAAIPAALLALLSLGAAGCYEHYDLPPAVPRGPLTGHAPKGLDTKLACGSWQDAASDMGDEALVHASFPETNSASCFVPVHYEGERAHVGAAPPGCEYPRADLIDHITHLRRSYDRVAMAPGSGDFPMELSCDLPRRVRAAAARQNARAIRNIATDAWRGKNYPYSTVAVFGFGHRDQAESVLMGYEPGQPCRPMSKEEMDLLTINVTRAGRGAMAHAAGVAPVVLTSGGAVHSPLIEAFALAHLLHCRFGVPEDRILVDPCADHTHTNLKHTGRMVSAIKGRAAYVVTDDGLQAEYLEDWVLWRWIGGDLDQRALRDWGYLLGSWRRASRGMRAGFWYTPYRFWAEPREALGSFTCMK